jgi:quinol monooxygenase YgiN
VIATVETKEGKRDEYLAIFKANVPNVLAEDGCLEYGATVDVEGSELSHITGAPNNNSVIIIEKWASLQAL